MEIDDLRREFAKAGLEARHLPGREVFFCRIARETRRGRARVWFNLSPGAAGNVVRVLDADRGLRQLVLMVHEPARSFEVDQYEPSVGKMVRGTVRVNPEKRKFLMGMDERDLFMAQLPKDVPVTTVRQAREGLNPLKSLPEAPTRQGEWFFVPAAKAERAAIAAAERTQVRRKFPIGGPGRGKPHTADEYLRIVFAAPPAAGEAHMFVRGKVRHPDHATVRFLAWRRAVPNTENRGSNARWID